MQTHLPLKNDHICMKDVQCAEMNENLIFQFFRFLIFELWSKFLEYFEILKNYHFFVPEDA